MKSLEQRVAYLEQMLNRFTGKQESWVKASVIMEATGWDKERLRRARINGEVKFKKDGGFFYLFESISTIHLKQQRA